MAWLAVSGLRVFECTNLTTHGHHAVLSIHDSMQTQTPAVKIQSAIGKSLAMREKICSLVLSREHGNTLYRDLCTDFISFFPTLTPKPSTLDEGKICKDRCAGLFWHCGEASV